MEDTTHWFIEPYKKYADVAGRARREEFWSFYFFLVLLSVATAASDQFLGLMYFNNRLGVINSTLALLTFVPSITVAVRRLHDTNRSGWWLWLAFIPVLGWIMLLIWFCQDSQPGTNRYGQNPRAVEA